MPVRRQTKIYTMREMFQTGQTLIHTIPCMCCVYIWKKKRQRESHAIHRSDLLVCIEEFVGESSWAFSKRILVVNGFF